MCSLVLSETDLYPHSNPGTMTPVGIGKPEERKLINGAHVGNRQSPLVHAGRAS